MGDNAAHEAEAEEHKVGFDGPSKAKAQLVKEIVALANTAGGRIIIGIDASGEVVGVDSACVKRLDPARVGDYLTSYIGDQRVAVAISIQSHGSRWLVHIDVAPREAHPIVMERDGTFESRGRQDAAFSVGSVIVRDSTRARPATRSDFSRWWEEARRLGERAAFEMMREVAERPPGTVLRFVVPETAADRLRAAAAAYAIGLSAMKCGGG